MWTQMLPSNSVCPVMLVIADSTWSLVDETTHGAEEKCWQSLLCTKFWNPENRCQEIHSLIWSVTYLKIGGLGRESQNHEPFRWTKRSFFSVRRWLPCCQAQLAKDFLPVVAIAGSPLGLCAGRDFPVGCWQIVDSLFPLRRRWKKVCQTNTTKKALLRHFLGVSSWDSSGPLVFCLKEDFFVYFSPRCGETPWQMAFFGMWTFEQEGEVVDCTTTTWACLFPSFCTPQQTWSEEVIGVKLDSPQDKAPLLHHLLNDLLRNLVSTSSNPTRWEKKEGANHLDSKLEPTFCRYCHIVVFLVWIFSPKTMEAPRINIIPIKSKYPVSEECVPPLYASYVDSFFSTSRWWANAWP